MKAVTWHGTTRRPRRGRCPTRPIQEPTDAIVRITSSGLCGSDLHLYEMLGPFMGEGDVLGHEPMGIVEEVGAERRRPQASGDRVVIPFQISLRPLLDVRARACRRSARRPRCASRARAPRCSATPSCTARCPAAQAEYLRVPQAQYMPIKVPEGPPDERFLFLSDVLPTAWQAVEYADVPEGGTLLVLGLGPIGDMAARIALHRGRRAVIGVDLVPERLARVQRTRRRGHRPARAVDDVGEEVRALTDGPRRRRRDRRGRHGGARLARRRGRRSSSSALLPEAVCRAADDKAGARPDGGALHRDRRVRRGGTVSLIGVYGGRPTRCR